AECRMGCNIVNPLAADIDDAPVTQRFEVLLAGAQHGGGLPIGIRANKTLSCGTPFAEKPAKGRPMPDSLGYRRKFAVIAPSTNTSVQPEFDAMAPRGVTNHFGRISIPNDPIHNDDDFNQLMDNIRSSMMDTV